MKHKVLILFIGLALPFMAQAQYHVGLDYAHNYSSWINGTNQGLGFTPWELTTQGTAGFFLGSSQTNGFGNVDVDEKSFGMYGNPAGDNYAHAKRGVTNWADGAIFEIELAIAYRNGNKGIDLLGPANEKLFNFNAGDDKYTAQGNDLGWSYEQTSVFHITVTQVGANLNISVNRGNSYSTTINNASLGSFDLYCGSTEQGSALNNLYFNRLIVRYDDPAQVPPQADVEIVWPAVELAADETLTVKSLKITYDAFTLKSNATGTASLISTNDVTGVVKAERWVNNLASGETWHYVSSPVAGQSLDQTWLDNNSIVSTPAYQLFRYDEDENYWIIYGSTGNPEAFTDNTFVEARGYTAARSATGALSFTGTVRNSDVTYATSYTTGKGEGWNLVGNPFTSAMGVTAGATSTGKFLADNAAVIDASYLALYIWDEQADYANSRNDYKVISSGTIDGYIKLSQDYIQPGQAFMVKVKPAAGNLAFNKDMQQHANVNFYKSKESWPSVELVVEGNNVSNVTSVGFNNAMTSGLDPSYDVGKLKGNPDIALYTRLVDDNGVDFAIQALPFDNIESHVVPVGVDVSTSGVYTFSANAVQLDNYNIVLEDKQQNTFTNLKQEDYSAEISQSGTGRFYLHFKNATAITEPAANPPVVDVKGNVIEIYNLKGNKTDVALLDLTGRTLDSETYLNSKQAQFVADVAPGIYLVQISSGQRNHVIKVFIQ
ncbi:MAG: T9SS type A sorting domain-containing protein [Clostridia bacterium]|nr:T9SS type A sorting domain-containing protein [Clostridia bacterium]